MAATDLPPESAGRVTSATFSSGLTVPDFAACLHMGMRPVALVQGYCVMRWSWVMNTPYYTGTASRYRSLSSYSCPHGYYATTAEHPRYGYNNEWTGLTDAWAEGYNQAYHRMIEEAAEAGAHGVIGVVDSARSLVDSGIREFHIYGTAVVVEDEPAPKQIWTSYLAGERLAKLIEAGFFPVSVVASMAAVFVNPVCVTEILDHGRWDQFGVVQPSDENIQMADAEMQSRRLARDHVKTRLGSDRLHGASLETGWSAGACECTIRGTRGPRFREAEPLEPPRPTVRLS
jgi:hypothetical protein